MTRRTDSIMTAAPSVHLPEELIYLLESVTNLPAAEVAACALTHLERFSDSMQKAEIGHQLLDNIARGVGGPRNPAVLTSVTALLDAVGDLTIERCEQVLRPVGDSHAIDTVLIACRS